VWRNKLKKQPVFLKIIIPLVALSIGLIIGLGLGHSKMKTEQKVFQDKIKEANRKIAFLQEKMTEEKTGAISIEQQCQGELDKLDKLQNEKKALGEQLGKLKEQMQPLEMKVKESDETSAKARKLEMKVKELDEASAKTKKELQEMERSSKDLDRELKKITGEKQTLQAELKKKDQEFGSCVANNAELCIIAEELLKKYQDKGVGAALLQKEPLTQIKKVELEKIIQQYQEEIGQHKVKKNEVEGKNVNK
jgi:myosin protein heavy chain